MKIERILTILAVITGPLFAQNQHSVSTKIPTMNFPQGYVVESISGRGFVYCTGGTAANISSSNPAAMFDFSKTSFGINGQWESEIFPATLADIGHRRDKAYLPQSLGAVFPYHNIRLGIGMSQRYNSILDFGLLETTTIENPDGTGEKVEATRSNIVIATSVLAAYSFRDMINTDDRLNLRIQCNYNYLDMEDKIFFDILNIEADGWGVSIGLHYQDPDLFQFGVFYERNPYLKNEGEYEMNSIISENDPVSVDNSQNSQVKKITIPFTIDSKLPDRLNIGFMIDPVSFLKISYGVTKTYWKKSSGISKCTQDIWCSISCNVTENLLFTMGYLSSNRNFEKTAVYYWIGQENDCNYLLFGLNWQIRRFNLDFAFMHTTPGSGEWRKQQIGKAAIGIEF